MKTLQYSTLQNSIPFLKLYIQKKKYFSLQNVFDFDWDYVFRKQVIDAFVLSCTNFAGFPS